MGEKPCFVKFSWPIADNFQAKALEMLKACGKFNGDYLRNAFPKLSGKSDSELRRHIADRKMKN